jgi:hypothetical protein
MESLLEKDRHIVAEVLVFRKEYISHKYPLWEICYNPEGGGVIVDGDKREKV